MTTTTARTTYLRARAAGALLLMLAVPAGARAQSASSSAATDASRPATTTFLGDTGLWFVPTAEVLPHGKWSITGYRRGTNYVQGYTNVGDLAGTFGFGIKDRVELFGSFLADTRIDRDIRPIFVNDQAFGGIVDRHPGVNRGWTGDNVGDFYLGAKFNLWSEFRRNPAALAVRGLVKLPTGKTGIGTTTGKTDVMVDVIGSKELARSIAEISGFAGYEFRGSPEGVDAPTGALRWGAGIAVPSRWPVRFTGELNGLLPNKDSAELTSLDLTGLDGSIPPDVSATENITRATLGLTAQIPKGFFLGVGLSWNLPRQRRAAGLTAPDDTDPFADYWDWQVRIGYHPGVRRYVPPPPPPTPAPPPPLPPVVAAVHDLTVQAACDPCTVDIGLTSTVTATAQDSTMCVVTYRWSAPAGTLQTPASRQSLWTAPNQVGPVPVPVPVTVTVTCPTDGKTASDTVNIQVTRPPIKTYAFEDVYFDFDRYTLRPEATRILDEAVTAMRGDAALRLQIEGNTCNIGTAEYNLALGDRRAVAVRDYFVSRGIPADRLVTVSYGEERPKFDNAREETRRLNRRASLVVNLR